MDDLIVRVEPQLRIVADEALDGRGQRGARDVADARLRVERGRIDLRHARSVAERAHVLGNAVGLARTFVAKQRFELIQNLVRHTVGQLDLDLPEAPHDAVAVDHANVVLDHLRELVAAVREHAAAHAQRAQLGDALQCGAAKVCRGQIESGRRHRLFVAREDVLLAEECLRLRRDRDLQRPTFAAPKTQAAAPAHEPQVRGVVVDGVQPLEPNGRHHVAR